MHIMVAALKKKYIRFAGNSSDAYFIEKVTRKNNF